MYVKKKTSTVSEYQSMITPKLMHFIITSYIIFLLKIFTCSWCIMHALKYKCDILMTFQQFLSNKLKVLKTIFFKIFNFKL